MTYVLQTLPRPDATQEAPSAASTIEMPQIERQQVPRIEIARRKMHITQEALAVIFAQRISFVHADRLTVLFAS